MRRILSLIIGLSCYLALPVGADNELRVPTMTRLVAEFQGKEVELIAALKAGNREKVDELVDPAFQLEPGMRGGADFVPYGRWVEVSIRQASGYADQPLNLAARDFGAIAAVTFEWEVLPGTTPQAPQRYHVTDLWKSHEGVWRLAFRTISLLASPKQGTLPGQPRAEPVIPKKY